MREYLKLYIDGAWVVPAGLKTLPVENPATEKICGTIVLGDAVDVDNAAKAAHRAFEAWSKTSREERTEVLARVIKEYERRADELAVAITEEMGAPAALAQRAQVPLGLGHFKTALDVLKTFSFEQRRGSTLIRLEPIGVCALITPWNWPLNQITCKLAPALAAGCTMVLKPSEVAPFSGQLLAEILDAAGVPAGVFNLVHGDGPGVGAPLSSHPLVDMVSFTGSTRAGVEVAKAAAPTVKRVAQELGGKSPMVIVDDPGFESAVRKGVGSICSNSGQTCSVSSRMLVPLSRMRDAIDIARDAVGKIVVGDPRGAVQMGPVVSNAQWNKIQQLIQAGIEEGATLVAGGLGRPHGLSTGYYVRPTIFANVTGDMAIGREEIFGPVLSIIAYDGIPDAIRIANDTVYGLAAEVYCQDPDLAIHIASQIRAGRIAINGGNGDLAAPWGGYKMSGNGREWGEFGFHEYLETKAILGCVPMDAVR